jgi:Asp-tRNA(Asn)/Glu-tRNA(Gln) amidotransferase A subunit family amidase
VLTLTTDTSPARFADAPVGLQLVCRRFEDEKVVEAYEYLQSLGVFDVQ